MFFRKLGSFVDIQPYIKKYSSYVINGELSFLLELHKVEQIERLDTALFYFNKAIDILEKLATIPGKCFSVKVSWRFENILFSTFDEIAKGERVFGPICEFDRKYFDKGLEIALAHFNRDFQYVLRKSRQRTNKMSRFYLHLAITPYLSVHPGNKRRKIATVSCTMHLQEVELF